MSHMLLRLALVVGLLQAGPAAALVTLATTTLASSSSNAVTAVDVPRPAALADGQVMLAVVGDRAGSVSSVSAAPTGWTLLRSVASSGSLSMKVYVKVVSNAAGEPATYTWTLASSTRASAAILAFNGVDTTAPVDASAGQASAASSTYRAPSLTTTGADRLLIAFYAASNGNAVTNVATGMSLVFDNGGSGAGPNGVAVAANQQAQSIAGASGNKDSTGNSTLVNAGVLVALTPSAVLGPDHYELSLPASGVSCESVTVRVTACADASSPCTRPYGAASASTAQLLASAGTLGASTVSFDGSGVATTTLSHPLAANGSVVSVTLSNEQLAASRPRQCCAGGVTCTAASSCSVTFSTAGFIIAGVANGAAVTIPTQTAGTASAGHVLRAIQTNQTTGSCVAALAGSTTVDWAAQCNNPNTCSAGNRMTITANGTAAVAGNPNSGVSAYTAVPMVFDANGNAPFSLNYADVGQVSLHARKSASGALLSTLSGSSNAFVVKPGGFVLSNIRQTAAPQLANPAAASATGSKFVAAGEAFSATVTAVTSSGAAAPNYGNETVREGALLTRALVLPSGGATGTLANATLAGTAFSGGVATATTLSFSEVGIITLTASVADGDYLGAGNVTGTTSANIGRFVPAKFALSAGSITHRSGLSCTPASSFTHLGENFRLGFTLTAQNLAGATTTNYSGSFAKLDPTAAAGWNLAGIDGSTVFSAASGRLALASATGSWSSGVAVGITLTANAARAAGPDGPFNAAFGIAPVDSDGVAITAYDLDTDNPANGADHAAVASVALRFGRLRLSNAIGAADRPLSLPVAAQYWNGTSFAANTLDSCTTVPASAVSFGNLRRTLTTTDTAVASPVAIAAGLGTLQVAAPAAGRRGTLDVALSLGSTAADASCLQPWSPGSGDAATAGANLAFLRGAWCGSAYDKDPAARASFGLQRGHDGLIYRREHY